MGGQDLTDFLFVSDKFSSFHIHFRYPSVEKKKRSKFLQIFTHFHITDLGRAVIIFLQDCTAEGV